MRTATFVLALGLVLAAGVSPAAAQSWPAVFDPLQVLSLNLEMTPGDWSTVQNDDTFEIEVPAMFNAAGEAPILVSVRRKSATPLQNGTPFRKVALKIDINQFVTGQSWHGLKKLSLETGAEQNVVSEGIAWHLNRLASGPAGYDYRYPAAMAAWVRLTINGTDTGVYLSVEQRDKKFLEHRGLYVENLTWLYKVGDIGGLEFEVGETHSPTAQYLCYRPFEAVGAVCPTPGPATLAAELPPLINMRSMLTLAAVDAILCNGDGIFSHAKNFFFADFAPALGRTRMYFPWDLDAVMGGQNYAIYAPRSAYSTILLAVPEFRAQYSRIMNDLVCGPLREEELLAFVNAVEPVLSGPLAADPNSRIEGPVAAFFQGRRAWLTTRLAQVASQIEGYTPCAPACYANCDGSSVAPVLNVNDFVCFQTRFSAGDPYANCDGSSQAPVLNINDFICFQTRFAQGCP